MKRILLTAVTSLAMFMSPILPAMASNAYPERPVRVVVPFPPGTATDMAARLVAEQLQRSLGQSFVVENKPGAGGNIGAMEVVRAQPDGYTIMFASNSAAASNAALYKQIPYDPTKDFTPIAGTGVNTLVLMVRDDFPARTLEEFLAYAKKHPGKLNAGYGSSSSQICAAMLAKLGGLDILTVPYKGITLAVNDVIGGSLDFTFVDVGNAMAQEAGGRLRSIAVASADRNRLMPHVRPIAEILPGFDITAWFAIVGPAGIPKNIVDKLYHATARALQDKGVVERLATAGVTPAVQTPDQLASFIASEVDKWKMLVKESNIQPL